jgi:hypothetical protein
MIALKNKDRSRFHATRRDLHGVAAKPCQILHAGRRSHTEAVDRRTAANARVSASETGFIMPRFKTLGKSRIGEGAADQLRAFSEGGRTREIDPKSAAFFRARALNEAKGNRRNEDTFGTPFSARMSNLLTLRRVHWLSAYQSSLYHALW